MSAERDGKKATEKKHMEERGFEFYSISPSDHQKHYPFPPFSLIPSDWPQTKSVNNAIIEGTRR